jgi:hypothetical protein
MAGGGIAHRVENDRAAKRGKYKDQKHQVAFQNGRAKKYQTKEAKQDAGYFHDANSCKKNGHKNLLLAVRCRARAGYRPAPPAPGANERRPLPSPHPVFVA